MSTLLSNHFPTIPDVQGRRLAVIGDHPSLDDLTAGHPFADSGGRLLRLILAQSGISPESCFFGNISQHALSPYSFTSPTADAIAVGTSTLTSDLTRFNPRTCLLVGRHALRAFYPDICYSSRVTDDNPDGINIPLSNWRGSVFLSPTFSYKSVPTYSPTYILRSFSDIAYFRADVARAVRHSSDATFTPTLRTGNLRPTLEEVLQFLSHLRSTRSLAAFDIEGYSDAVGVTMLSICPSETSGLVIPFYISGEHYWSEEEEPIVWSALSSWLADETCPKICHNALYETTVLGWRHQCLVAGIVDDTMFKQWEIYNELEKSLGVCTSLWIEEPYYKDDRRSDGDTKLNYNFKDSACTFGINTPMERYLLSNPSQHAHYKFNVSLINPFTYMHLRGCRFDTSRASAHSTRASEELSHLNSRIDAITLPVLGHPFNVKSTHDKQWLLYDFLGHEPSKRWGKSTKEELLLRYYSKRKDEVLRLVIQAVSLRTRLSDIEKLTPNSDGRIRTAYDPVATVTGRLNSRSSSITEQIGVVKSGPRKGSPVYQEFGTNLQNVTKALRDVFVTDSDDYLFFQADLEGADAWTVAADLAACGDSRMLDDLRARVKPSKLLLRMLEEIESGRDPSLIARMDSAQAKIECDKVLVPEGLLPDGRPADWKYVTMKRVQHGTNYLGKPETIAAVIFKDSDGLIDVPVSTVDKYQRLYLLRYNIDLRRRYIHDQLSTTGCLVTASGTRRKFFGIRNSKLIDDELIRQAMASEPQTNTTYSTNLALSRLWRDPANRRRSGGLFIEPLLQVHDALAGQFPARLRDFARDRINTYFDNELTIHGIKITIPADIKVGRSWGECKEKI